MTTGAGDAVDDEGALAFHGTLGVDTNLHSSLPENEAAAPRRESKRRAPRASLEAVATLCPDMLCLSASEHPAISASA